MKRVDCASIDLVEGSGIKIPTHQPTILFPYKENTVLLITKQVIYSSM